MPGGATLPFGSPITFVTAFLVDKDGNPAEDPEPWSGDDDTLGSRLVAGRFTDPSAPDEFTAGHGISVFASETVVGEALDVALEGRPGAGTDEDDDRPRTGSSTVDRRGGDAGDGTEMTFAGYAALVPDATRNVILVNFVEGADHAAADRFAGVIQSQSDTLGTPTSITALDRVMLSPFLLAGLLGILAAVVPCRRATRVRAIELLRD